MNSRTILAIDTSTAFLRLAVQFGSDRLVQSNERADRSHGQMIMRQIANVLESSGGGIDTVSAVIVCTGPGSFTGLRVGIAVAKGIAVGRAIPVVGVSLFEVALQRLGEQSGRVLAVVPHRRGEYFVSPIGKSVNAESVRVVPESELLVLASQNRLIGIGLNDPIPAGIEPFEYNASDLLHVGMARLEAGSADSIETLEPLYCGKSQAEIKFEQRHAK